MTSKTEMVNFINRETGYSKKFLRTKTEAELESKIHGMSIIEMYGSEETKKLLFRGRYPIKRR